MNEGFFGCLSPAELGIDTERMMVTDALQASALWVPHSPSFVDMFSLLACKS